MVWCALGTAHSFKGAVWPASVNTGAACSCVRALTGWEVFTMGL